MNESATATSERPWLREVEPRDLQDIHHALRMIVKHPMVTGEEARLFTNLADACWAEHCRRVEAERV